MPKEIVERYTVWKFEEHPDQQACLDRNRDCEVQDSFWYEFIYDASISIAAMFGVTIDRIYFSGFWSQGDGACFEGGYEHKEGGLEAVKEYAPKDEELHKIVEEYYREQADNDNELHGYVKHNGFYQHSGCTEISMYKGDDFLDAEQDSIIDTTLRAYMDWIYDRLEKEYDYYTSDKYLKERFREMGTWFHESGEVYEWSDE